MLKGYPQPVSVVEGDDDLDGYVVIHRKVLCEHTEGSLCECRPWVYSCDELARPETRRVINARLIQQLQ